LAKEEPIAEEELTTEEWVEERIGKASVSEAQVVTESWPNKYGPRNKRAWDRPTEPTLRRGHDTKTRTYANLSRNSWALHGPQLSFQV
jgi:hypothetical protein